MGIYIKGIEMPKDKAIAVVIHPDGTAYSAEMSAGVCTEYLKDCVAIPVSPQWISVTERLPEERINPNTMDFEYVLCATIWGDVRPFKYGAQIGQRVAHFWNGAGYVDAYVTHWMPLPPPPAVDTEEQP